VAQFTFPLPDVGEGLTEAEIVHWHVKPGDHIAVNQIVCEIETAKSLVELPSPFRWGWFTNSSPRRATRSRSVPPIISVTGEGDEPEPEPDTGATQAVADSAGSVSQEESAPVKNLVGYGAGATDVVSRRRRTQPAPSPQAAVEGSMVAPGAAEGGSVLAKPPFGSLPRTLEWIFLR